MGPFFGLERQPGFQHPHFAHNPWFRHGFVDFGRTSPLSSNSPYSFILVLTSVFSRFGTGNQRFQLVCTACRRALGRVLGTDMRVS